MSFCNKRSFLLNQICSKKLQVCACFHGLLLQKDIKGLSLKQPFPILSKVNELTAVLWKLQIVLPRHFLLSICKAFIRPHLDCSDVIYDKIFNASWHKKLESAQYNAALAIIGIIWSTNNVKLYQGLGFRVLPKQARVEKISLFCKINLHCIFITQYLQKHQVINNPLKNVKKNPIINVRHKFLEKTFSQQL